MEDERRIAERSERHIAFAMDRARHELKAYAPDFAVTLAAAQLHESISTDQALVRTLSINWDKRNNNASACPSGSSPRGVRERQSHQRLTQETITPCEGLNVNWTIGAFHASTVCLLTNHIELAAFKGS